MEEKAGDIEVKNEDDLQHLLGKMSEEGYLHEHIRKGDFSYSLTERGKHDAIAMFLKDRTARLYMIQIHNIFSTKEAGESVDWLKSVLVIAKLFKKEFGINLFKDIVDAVEAEELDGITFESEHNKQSFIAMYEQI